MRTWEEPKKKRLHIEIVPMIDVMMFLLVFFPGLVTVPARWFAG